MNDNLMNGLKLVDVYNVKNWNLEFFVICAAFLLVGFIFLILNEKYDSDSMEDIGMLCVLGSLLVGIIIFACTLYHNFFAPTREFQVTCDESISFYDIENEYDVISFDGEVYTIREEVE